MQEESGRDRVERWADFNARPEDVWKIVSKFAEIDAWHPGVAACEAVSLDGEPHRHVTVAGDGGMILEKLISNEDMTQRYEIIESPLPVDNYRATLTVFAHEGGTRVFWSSSYEPTSPEADAIVAAIYEGGLRGLRDYLGE
ncbi:SRPBCC family protein [Rhodovulum sp. DZ06]|uniref:SRPBCC family protein n=1 Tax=Rhodovulum sp. DZ06 TaxID=3425126 RepID=UPI003D3387E5